MNNNWDFPALNRKHGYFASLRSIRYLQRCRSAAKELRIKISFVLFIFNRLWGVKLIKHDRTTSTTRLGQPCRKPAWQRRLTRDKSNTRMSACARLARRKICARVSTSRFFACHWSAIRLSLFQPPSYLRLSRHINFIRIYRSGCVARCILVTIA